MGYLGTLSFRRLIPAIAPVVFLLFTACGGGDDPPPPIASQPQATKEIECAAKRMDEAIDKCKGGLNDVLPLILMSKKEGEPMNPAILAAVFGNKGPQKAPAPPVQPQADDKCEKPQTDKETTCNDDLITAMLLVKSAPDKSGQRFPPWFEQWITQLIISKGATWIASMGLSPQQGQVLLGVLKEGFTNYFLNNASFDPAMMSSIMGILSKAPASSTATTTQSYPTTSLGLGTSTTNNTTTGTGGNYFWQGSNRAFNRPQPANGMAQGILSDAELRKASSLTIKRVGD